MLISLILKLIKKFCGIKLNFSSFDFFFLMELSFKLITLIIFVSVGSFTVIEDASKGSGILFELINLI